MLNQIINKVCNFLNNLFLSIVYIAMIYIWGLAMVDMQVLALDNFVSMDQLKTSANVETVDHVKSLILQKLRNQMKQLTKTDVLLKRGFMTSE